MPSYQIAKGRTIIHGGATHAEGTPCGFLCPADVVLFLRDGVIVPAPDCKPVAAEPEMGLSDDEPEPGFVLPGTFPAAKALPEWLESFDSRAEVLALWDADGRSSADRHYKKRLAAL